MDQQNLDEELRSKVEKVPREIYFNIFSRLPLKSVIQSSCVSKSWLDITKDPYFVKLHVSRSEPDPSLLILKHRVLGGNNIISISPINCKPPYLKADETVIDHMASSFQWNLVGTCDGLLCFTYFGEETITMVCNPVTREHIILPKSAIGLSSGSHTPSFAFGFDPVSKKYKVVRVLFSKSPGSGRPRRVGRIHIPVHQVQFHADPDNHEEEINDDPGNNMVLHADHEADMLPVPESHRRNGASHGPLMRAEVYTLGTDSWREVQGCIYPYLNGRSVFVNGVVYWLVGDFSLADRILSFDLGTEQFKLTQHRRFGTAISLTELEGCLAVVDLSPPNHVEISVLKDPASNFWELAYIIPIVNFGHKHQQSHRPRMVHRHPKLICVHEPKDGILIWLNDNLLIYEKNTFITRHPRITDFPTWLNWKICSGYKASLVPLGNSCGTSDNRGAIIHFISDWELGTHVLRGVAFSGQDPDDWCEEAVTSFQQNHLLI